MGKLRKSFVGKNCCLNCNWFSYWDGDYCCLAHMKIHQYGENMTTDIDKTMKTPSTCNKYIQQVDDIAFIYEDEYRKYRELKELEEQLDKHVNFSNQCRMP